MPSGRTLVIGSGFGYSLVEKLAIGGYQIVAVSRNIGCLEPLINKLALLGYSISAYSCGVTDESSVKSSFLMLIKNLAPYSFTLAVLLILNYRHLRRDGVITVSGGSWWL